MRWALKTEKPIYSTWYLIEKEAESESADSNSAVVVDVKFGMQEEHCKEFYFTFRDKLAPLSGRWVMSYLSSEDGGRGLLRKQKEQRVKKKGEVLRWSKTSDVL